MFIILGGLVSGGRDYLMILVYLSMLVPAVPHVAELDGNEVQDQTKQPLQSQR